MATKKQPKLAQRQINVNGYNIYVSLVGDCGCVSIEDNNLYPDGDSRADRRNLNFHTMMIPLMTREQLKDLHIAISEVLKHSK
jgi:hypothetical protein